MSAAILPQRVEIHVLADGRPLPGALIDVTLSMTSKNSHTMVFGPADADGRIVISREQLIEEARRNQHNFIMDYADLSAHFAGSMEVAPVTPKRVKEIQQAHARFAEYFTFPAQWRETLNEADKWFASHSITSLEARVAITPPGAKLSLPVVKP